VRRQKVTSTSRAANLHDPWSRLCAAVIEDAAREYEKAAAIANASDVGFVTNEERKEARQRMSHIKAELESPVNPWVDYIKMDGAILFEGLEKRCRKGQ
jgi:hypothetical protein